LSRFAGVSEAKPSENVACLYAVLHRTEDALKCLRRVVRSGWRKEWIKMTAIWIPSVTTGNFSACYPDRQRLSVFCSFLRPLR
jgi:hypothetical protein